MACEFKRNKKNVGSLYEAILEIFIQCYVYVCLCVCVSAGMNAFMYVGMDCTYICSTVQSYYSGPN